MGSFPAVVEEEQKLISAIEASDEIKRAGRILGNLTVAQAAFRDLEGQESPVASDHCWGWVESNR